MELKMDQSLMMESELRGAEVDLASWLFGDDQDKIQPDFWDGAKETNCLSYGGMGSISPSVITTEDLPGQMETTNINWEHYSSYLDDYLSQNFQKDPCDLSELKDITWGSFDDKNDSKEKINLQSDINVEPEQPIYPKISEETQVNDRESFSVSPFVTSSTGFHILPDSPASMIDDEAFANDPSLYSPVRQFNEAVLDIPDSPLSDQESSNDISQVSIDDANYIGASPRYAKIITVPISAAISNQRKAPKSIRVKRVTIPKSEIQTILTAKHTLDGIRKKPKRVVMNMKRVTQQSSPCALQQETPPVLKDIISHEGDNLLRQIIPYEIEEEQKPEILLNESDTMCDQDEFEDSMKLEISEGIVANEDTRDNKRGPYSLSERKLRKKEQNKRAALRYRQKKKEEEGTVQSALEIEEQRKKELTDQYNNLKMELKLVKKLVREIYMPKK